MNCEYEHCSNLCAPFRRRKGPIPRFCSKHCSTLASHPARKPAVTRACRFCGNNFVSAWRKRTVYCSHHCSDAFRARAGIQKCNASKLGVTCCVCGVPSHSMRKGAKQCGAASCVKEYHTRMARLRATGWEHDVYSRALVIQRGVCALCFRPKGKKQLSADHMHATGRRRSILCHSCNMYYVGRFDRDPEYLLRIVAYIQGHAVYTADLAAAQLAAEAATQQAAA